MASSPSGVTPGSSSSVRKNPGAMTLAMQAISPAARPPATHLRVGLVDGARLVHEETLAPGARLSIEDLRELAVHRDGRWQIRVGPGARGRVASGGKVTEIASDTEAFLLLDEGARGRLERGDRVVLFQLVEGPTARTRPQLPASVRAGLFHQIDAAFTAVVMASFLVHIGFVSYLENADWPAPATIAALPPDAIEMLVQPLDVEPDAPIELPSDAPPDEVADATPTSPSDPAPTAPRDRSSSHGGPRSADPSPEIDTAEIMASLDMMLIGASGPGGALADVLADGAVTPDTAEVFASANAVSIATTSTAVLHDRSGTSRVGPPGDIGHLDRAGDGTGGHDEGTIGETVPVTPAGIYTPPVCELDCGPDPTGFDMTALVRAIRGRSSRITRCYEHELMDDPTLAGRVEIGLTVERAGTLSHLRAVENTTGSDEVAACITRSIADIRVHPGPAEPVSVEFPFVFAPAD